MSKKSYNSPSMEVHALKVERGFAGTGDFDDDSDLEFGNSKEFSESDWY